jgi:hypothetical protein
MERLTSKDRDTPCPLGQCIKEYKITDIDEAEYCSKWFFECAGEVVVTRDYLKTLLTKQYYSR